MIECLEKQDKPLARSQIAEDIKEDPIKVSHIINRLLKSGEIKCVELDRIQSGMMLGLGRPFRRTRFYYI